MNIDLTGRTVLVTGGSGELGRVIAKTMAACGADVIIHYYGNRDRALEVVQDIEQMGRRSTAIQANITNQESIIAMRDCLYDTFGKPDILINNAVVQYEWKSILDQEVKDFMSQFESCAMQTVYMAKAFLPHMIEQGYGRIVVTNTECAYLADANTGAYVAGKRALDGIVRTLAKEVGKDGITVNQVAPGWTISDNDRINGTEKAPDYDQTVPLGHRGEDQDIANAMAFLASDLARYITGVYLPVTGGRVMPAI